MLAALLQAYKFGNSLFLFDNESGRRHLFRTRALDARKTHAESISGSLTLNQNEATANIMLPFSGSIEYRSCRLPARSHSA